MPVIGWLLVVFAVWLVDSAVHGRPPVTSLRDLITTGKLPTVGPGIGTNLAGGGTTIGKSPTPNAPGAQPSDLPSSDTWDLGPTAYTGGDYYYGPKASGSVDSWIAQASQVLAQNGDAPLSADDLAAVRLIIKNESGGQNNIVNGFDINAKEGHPSIGLMQTIASTFRQWALPGHHNIINPVDNIIAGVRYARGRYGSLENVPGVVSTGQGGGYEPY